MSPLSNFMEAPFKGKYMAENETTSSFKVLQPTFVLSLPQVRVLSDGILVQQI